MCSKETFFALYTSNFGAFPEEELKNPAVKREWEDLIDEIPDNLVRRVFQHMGENWRASSAKPRINVVRRSLKHCRMEKLSPRDRDAASAMGKMFLLYDRMSETPLFDFTQDGYPMRREPLEIDLPIRNLKRLHFMFDQIRDEESAKEFKRKSADLFTFTWSDYEPDEKAFLCRRWGVDMPEEEYPDDIPF